MQRASSAPWPLTLASESRLAGSAGTTTSTVRVSVAITPTGMPPSLQGGPQVGRGTGQHPRLVQGAGGSGQPRLIFYRHAGWDKGRQRKVCCFQLGSEVVKSLTNKQAGKVLWVPVLGQQLPGLWGGSGQGKDGSSIVP